MRKDKKIKYFKGEFLHPALDIKRNLLILGFRFFSEDFKERNLFVISNQKGISFLDEEHFEDSGGDYYIEIGNRKLARIEERWDLEELNNFIENYNLAISETPKIKEIFNKIKELLKKYMELEKEEDYFLIPAWIIGVYFFPVFSAYPFLHIKAPKQSGKTQCLNFLKQICFNAVKAKPSLPALCDTVDSLRGVYLIDQADLLKRKGNEELLEILTDSYKKESGKRRIRFSEKRGGWRTIEQETYSPKAFASVRELPEDLADRCLTIPLIKSERNFPEPLEESENWKEIRGELYKVLLTNFSVIKNSYDIFKTEYRQNSKIIGRDLELWLPLETILKFVIDEEELERIRQRFKQLYGYTTYEANELEKEVIRVIFECLEDGKTNQIILRPSEISQKIEDEFWEDKFLNSHQKGIRVGYIVKNFNLSSEKKDTSKGIAYLFEKEKILKIKGLYIKNEKNTPNTPFLTEKPENTNNLDEF